MTVKAYPGLGRTAGESVCVAGVRLDTSVPQWVRLWPVSFREFPYTDQFHKWQIIELDATKSHVDKRPESHLPDLDSIRVGEKIKSGAQWRDRRRLLGPLLGQTTLCDLMAAQESGRAVPSLGLVKVARGARSSSVMSRTRHRPQQPRQCAKVEPLTAGPSGAWLTKGRPRRSPCSAPRSTASRSVNSGACVWRAHASCASESATLTWGPGQIRCPE